MRGEPRPTDHSQLILARFQEEILFGKEFGKIIWQPRIGCWYNDKVFAGEEVPEEFKGMTLPEVYRKLKCSPRVYEYNGCFKVILKFYRKIKISLWT